MFATYALLAGKRGSERLDQLVRWCAHDFNGVLALDEALVVVVLAVVVVLVGGGGGGGGFEIHSSL